MNTPICDFVDNYIKQQPHRLHMPGHKGMGACEARDITEVAGADVLYAAEGIIAESERNAAHLFGTKTTLYSTEGSSLSIRAMLYLAMLYAKSVGRAPLILAGRNAHKSFLSALALLEMPVEWLYGGENLLSCPITAEMLSRHLKQMEQKPIALYITAPDYLGNSVDIKALAEVCHREDVLLLVDNAHGAYLRFLPEDSHPITLGADLCCDSAHKTLPVLTGGGYLHIAPRAPALFCEQAQGAMALFASTSPSYLILQSLDKANRYLGEGYRERLADFTRRVQEMKGRLSAFTFVGDEPLKVTLATKSYGYEGQEMAACLAEKNIVCEFADPDHLVLMLTPENGELQYIEDALRTLPQRAPILTRPPRLTPPRAVCSPREAMFSPRQRLPLEQCKGRVLGCATVSCPPAVPILVCGEAVDESAITLLRYYGHQTLEVIK